MSATENPMSAVGSGGSDGEDPSREIVSPDLPPLEKEPSVDEFNLNAEQVVTAVEAYEAKRIVEPVFRDTAIAATAEDDADVALLAAFAQNFMGHSPLPYKIYVVTAMLLNVGIRYGFGKPAAAWAVLVEFIITLAMAPYCYPLQPGGLIVIEGFLLGLATPKTFQHEVEMNLNVLLLVAFMVTCIHFLKNLLLWVFTNILVKIESKVLLSVAMMLVSAVLAAFLDALSVAAVIASVCSGVLGVYYHVVENADLPLVECLHHETMSYELVPHAPSRAARHLTEEQVRDILVEHPVHHEDQGSAAFSATAPDSGIHKVVNPIGHSSPASPAQSPSPDSNREAMARTASTGGPAPTSPASAKPIELAQAYGLHKEDILQFRNFLKSLLMHGAMGTALGACSTLVGGPRNLVIARQLGWDFATFSTKMLPVSSIAWVVGLTTCAVVESLGVLGYGAKMPLHVRQVLLEFTHEEYGKIHATEAAELIVQAVAMVALVLGLAFHITEVGYVGLGVAIIITTFNGIIEEHEIADAFLEAMPFVSLLVVFFGVVAIIVEQGIFEPIIQLVLEMSPDVQPGVLFMVNGLLSMVSDNVFVATIFIEGVAKAYHAEGPDAMNMTEAHFGKLGVAISMGTNLPSCATPNGQAAFLFILTSAIAPLVGLSYGRMALMALPYTLTLTVAGLAGVVFLI